MREKVRDTCKAVHGEDLQRCMEMGKIGAEWLWAKRGEGKSGKTGLKVITVCNTGSLATSVSSLLSSLTPLIISILEKVR